MGNIHHEIPVEDCLKKRHLNRKGRSHFETGKKGGKVRGAGPDIRSAGLKGKKAAPAGEGNPGHQAGLTSPDSQRWEQLPMQQPELLRDKATFFKVWGRALLFQTFPLGFSRGMTVQTSYLRTDRDRRSWGESQGRWLLGYLC